VGGASASDQINLTDEDPRIMPVAGSGFEQCYNAQAAVAGLLGCEGMREQWGSSTQFARNAYSCGFNGWSQSCA